MLLKATNRKQPRLAFVLSSEEPETLIGVKQIETSITVGRTAFNYVVRSGGFLLSRDGPELQNSTLPLLGCLDIGFWSRPTDASLRLIHTVESRVPWTVLGRGDSSDGQDIPRSGGRLPGDGEIQFRQAPSDSHARRSSSSLCESAELRCQWHMAVGPLWQCTSGISSSDAGRKRCWEIWSWFLKPSNLSQVSSH